MRTRSQTTLSVFWFNWILAVVLAVMALGLSMLLAPGLIRQAFSLLLYADPGTVDNSFGSSALEYVSLLHGVLGSVMFGWGAALLLVVCGPFKRGSREAWIMVCVSVFAWFVPDTLFSLWTGFWQNAVLNAAFLLLFAIPLVATRRVFRREHV